MDQHRLGHIIATWQREIPNRQYGDTCAFWAEDGSFTVYQAAGNPEGWGGKVVRKGPAGARELFSAFHDECRTDVYDVSAVTLDPPSRRAAWQVAFRGERRGLLIVQELAFMIELNGDGLIAKACIWPGNP